MLEELLYGIEQRILGFHIRAAVRIGRRFYRAMMGEYIVYYRGKVVGGIYDDCFLVKLTMSAVAMMPNADMWKALSHLSGKNKE